MINIKPKIKMGGVNYHFEVINKETGVIKQTVDSHNIFLNQWWSLWGLLNRRPRTIVFGIGTGTPSIEDTSLFTASSWGNIPIVLDTINTVINSKNKITVIYQGTVSATSTYVGSITEVGLFTSSILMTHSLITDSANNPITIEKTADDILNVVITYVIECTNSTYFKWLHIDSYFNRGLFKEDVSLIQAAGLSLNSKYMRLTNVFADTYSYDIINKKEIFSGRLELAEGNTHYYNSVITPYGYIPLPNANVFPNYYIPNIAIGTGNGVITDFINPLNYFIENTDIVYKNGVSLTRGTDYTIDYRNNREMLPELTPCVEENTIYAGQQDDLGMNRQPLFIAGDLNVDNTINITQKILDSPSVIFYPPLGSAFYITFENAKTLNLLRLYNIFLISNNASHNIYYNVLLECSTDNSIWTTVIPIGTRKNGADSFLFSFNTTIARYWRITFTDATYTTGIVYQSFAGNCFLGYVGDPYIKFTTAPADGDVLTMSVQMDRPFKNNSCSIDLAIEVNLSH